MIAVPFVKLIDEIGHTYSVSLRKLLIETR